ncbi:hypothetical protein KX729_02050 [Rhizobium sp. XQZ8]|uniref:DUF6892 domain-containing protein n=1 Tax=Rhizobium populisoli TaxID=2859785 RepID=UPI001CA53909|nr:hypothetical protein [Rhizobium populisoli]MBW6420213.1 hypothetical protein [Rhizobium populisoli]
MNFEESLQQLFAAEPDNYDAVRGTRDIWKNLLQDDAGPVGRLYSLYFETVKAMMARRGVPGLDPAPDALDDLQGYKFIITFAGSGYLERHVTKTAAQELLAGHGEEHLALIEHGLQLADDRITERHLRLDTGCWGDIVGGMILLYRFHTTFGETGRALEATVTPYIPRFFRAFPNQENGIILHMLENHPQAVEEMASLIRLHLPDGNDGNSSQMESLFLDMLGYYADRNRFTHKNGKAILTAVMADIEDWPVETVRAFVNAAILKPLHIAPMTQEEAASEVRGTVNAYRNMLAKPIEGSLGMSAAQRKQNYEESLGEAEAELNLIETGFDRWLQKRNVKAFKRIGVSATTRAIMQAVVKRLPKSEKASVQDVLDAAAAAKETQRKKFPMPGRAGNRFKDFGLKLLVIEELMYRQNLLQPKFDVHEFAKEYEKREISVESDGYAIIPEVQQYFRDLAIGDDLLAKVETLHQSSGLDGGPAFIEHLYPFWDPGAGDDAIPVKKGAIDDLELLPNLKSISGLENSKPAKNLLAALQAHGIRLVSEEEASF